jgi:osmotically-inducible protein OsmY
MESGAGGGGPEVVALIDETLRSAGIYLAVQARDRAVVLSGVVEGEADREAALDVALAVAEPRGLTVEDAIEVSDGEEVRESFEDAGGREFAALDQDRQGPDLTLGTADVVDVEPDFTGNVGTTDAQLATEEGETYFAAVDPVVRPTNDAQELDVVGGFAESSLDPDDPATVFADPDDELAQAIRRELREDAATADLAPTIRVAVRNRIVTLRGVVETVEDAEEVEAVAARVGGVAEVREELDVTLLPHPADESG